ncbi:MAG: FHA domain-containing protein [Bradymonadales bacterium]|nr:MAG: FHA domain-containing protein [Bradymonadales bacterium]
MTTHLTIKFIQPEQDRVQFSLQPGQKLTFGRDANCDIPLKEKKISRKHCEIEKDANKPGFWIRDLGSLNGSFLNGMSLTQAKKLSAGDRIKIGSFEMEVDFQAETYYGGATGEREAFALSDEQYDTVDTFSPLSEVSVSANEDVNFSDYNRAAEKIESLSEESVLSEKTGGRLIAGKLTELSLADVLQMLATTQKSGQLVVSETKISACPKGPSQNTALIHLDRGQVKWAEFKDLQKEEAFFEALKLEKGFFALFPARDKPFEDVIEIPLESLLIQGLAYLDESRAHQVELQEEDELNPLPDEPLSQLSEDELRVFQLVWKVKTVGKVIEKSHLSKGDSIDTLKRLIRNGFITKTK